MKKVISFIAMLAILAGIMSTGPISASADNNIELKEALEIAKAAFNFDTRTMISTAATQRRSTAKSSGT